MSSWHYLTPFAYFLSTRLISPEKILSWLVIYPFALLLAYTTFTDELSIESFTAVAIAMLIIYTIYELGYMANDVFTVLHEVNPTTRLSERESKFIQAHWYRLLSGRVGLAILLLGVLAYLRQDGFKVFCLMLAIMSITFYLYNITRGGINIPLHFILVICRFSGPCMLVMPEGIFFAFTLLAFPIINLIERAAEPRYNQAWLQNMIFSNQKSGRWLYYLLASFLWAGVAIVLELELETLGLLIFLFIYRLVSPLLALRLARR